MPAVANPITFGGSSRSYGYNPPSRVEFDDLPYLQTPGGTRGVPTYTVGGGSGKPIRPGVGLGAGQGTTIVSGSSPISYNPNTRNNSFDVADDEYGPISTEDMLKAAATEQLLLGGAGALSAGLLGQNLTGVELGGGFLGQIPYIGQGLKGLNYMLNPTIANAYNAQGIMGAGKHALSNFNYGDALKFVDPNVGGTIVDGVRTFGPSISSGISSLAQSFGRVPLTSGAGLEFSSLTNIDGSPAMMKPGAEIGDFINYLKGEPSAFGGDLVPTADKFIAGKTPNIGTAPEYSGISGFFNRPRFGTEGIGGSGITSVGNILGTVGGLVSLADFIDDPSLASGLGTLAGAGASGIGAFSGLATAAPWLAGAALVASLLGNKKPSNKTGYTSIDLDEFKPVSFGMEGKKYSKENVDQTMKIMEPIIPAIQQLEEMYGVDLKGDIQVNYGGRDGLAYNIGNRDVTGFRNRLDYFDGRDQSTRDGGSIFRKTFKGENAGKDFYKSLLGDLETLAKQKQAEGGGEIDLANYRGVQRQVPQGIFSYGAPGTATPPKPKGGPQGVFTYGYNT
jgi:hypothetical protein